MEIEDESLGSTIAGWAETAAANAVEVPAAIVATCMDLSLSETFYVLPVTDQRCRGSHTFPPQQRPTTAHFLIVPLDSSSISLIVPGSASKAFAGFAGPWKYSPIAFWFSDELEVNHS